MLISIAYLTCSLSSGLLGWREVGPDAVGQLDTVLAALAAVMVGADRGLIHPRDHGRAKGRADRRGRAGPRESQALLRKAIDVRHLNRLPAVARKACRHVVNHELNNVGLHGGVRVRSRKQRPRQKQQRHEKRSHPCKWVQNIFHFIRVFYYRGYISVDLVGVLKLISRPGQTSPADPVVVSADSSHLPHPPTGRSLTRLPAACPRRSR